MKILIKNNQTTKQKTLSKPKHFDRLILLLFL